MKLNRSELKKIIYDFNSISNRLLQADFEDYNDVMRKYIAYTEATPIIMEYIDDCGPCEQDMAEEFKAIRSSHNTAIFHLGETVEEEVCNVFAIMNYIVDNNISVHWTVAGAYSSSTKFQDKIKAFNDRVIMVFIRHIESYLTKIGIDMGMDDSVKYSISISGGQVNIANDNAVINATNNNGIDTEQLVALIANVRKSASGLTEEDSESINDSLEIIEEEAKAEKPKRKIIKTAITALKAIKGSAEFAAAVAALVTFFQSFMS